MSEAWRCRHCGKSAEHDVHNARTGTSTHAYESASLLDPEAAPAKESRRARRALRVSSISGKPYARAVEHCEHCSAPPPPPEPSDAAFRAKAVVETWETMEGETFRDGHRVTLERLIALELGAVEARTRQDEREQLIERIVGSLKAYPDGGGDISIMGEVGRLLRDERERAARIAEGGRFLTDESAEARFGKAVARTIRGGGK